MRPRAALMVQHTLILPCSSFKAEDKIDSTATEPFSNETIQAALKEPSERKCSSSVPIMLFFLHDKMKSGERQQWQHFIQWEGLTGKDERDRFQEDQTTSYERFRE